MSIVPFPEPPAQDQIRSRAIRLFTFLRDVVKELRTTTIRDASNYAEVLWLSQVPQEPECSTLWRTGTGVDQDTWLRVRKPVIPPRPNPPPVLEPWVMEEDLDNPWLDFPPLAYEVQDESGGLISKTAPSELPVEASQAHNRYVEEQWWPWALKSRRVEPILAVYKRLFTIYQRQQQLGEQYEVVLGIGHLVWAPEMAGANPIKRHLLVANCSVEFDPDRAVISVGAGGDQTQLALEQDMVDPELRVSGAALEQVTQLIASDDALVNAGTLIRALRTWVNAASSSGSFSESLEPRSEVEADPVVALAPALILRRRTERSLVAMFEGIIANLQEDGAVPPGVRGLVEIEDDQVADGQASSLLGDGTIYFPLDANREQLEIVRKLSAHQGVLVQGPPGTGKSHTIANLVAHLLATGQRVLVTSQAPRALEVLRGLLPPEIAALAVLLLGADSKSIQSMEDSVHGLSAKFQTWGDDQAASEIAKLEDRRASVLALEAKVRGQLREARRRDAEDKVGPLAGGYQGTRQQVAEMVGAEAEEFRWLSGYQASGAPPLANSEALELLQGLRSIPDLRRQADSGRLPDPSHLPSPERFSQRVQAEATTRDHARRSAVTLREPLSPGLARIAQDRLEAAGNAVHAFVQELERLQPAASDWAHRSWADLLRGADDPWLRLCQDTERALATIDDSHEILTGRLVTGVQGGDREPLRPHVQALRSYLKQGRGTSFAVIRPKPVREAIKALRSVRVEGLPVSQLTSVETLLRWMSAWDQLDELNDLWKLINPAPQGPVAVQVAHFKACRKRLGEILDLRPTRERAAQAIQELPMGATTRLDNLISIRAYLATLSAESQRRQAVEASKHIEGVLAELRPITTRPDSDPSVGALLEAVESRDPRAYGRHYGELQMATARLRQAARISRLLEQLAGRLPQVADDLLLTAELTHWDTRLSRFEAAWHWACADSWLRQTAAPEPQQKLLRELEDLHQETLTITRQLASAKAWQHCLHRLTPAHRQHLQAWSQAMRRVGRGTGKYAASHRANARDHMAACRDAIPAWIMPIYRVAETMDPGVDSFDVVIVDEASQAGPEALFLNYLARKMVVVGDEMQISPEQVGLHLGQVDALARQHLKDIPHSDALTFRNSLFDQAKIRFGARVGLREHFRCMPEIIQFSNDLCYRNEPLIPVRQYGASRLSPVVVTRHIATGYLEEVRGTVNRPESQAVVDTIVQCCSDPAYDGKTMGVISLVGDDQAKLIETQLAKRLGPEEMERRLLTCGDAYAFQGAERHVIFLSMGSARSETRRMPSLTGERARQRFNVAGSRAQDQMWLFHSLTLDDFHTPEDMRYQLLKYCQNPHVEPTPEVAGSKVSDLERRARIRAAGERAPAPFESWFELDVFLRLVRRGYRVIPQYRVAEYFVDLMVEGMHGRVAVECDGDHWHGPDHYDRDLARQRELERCGLHFIRILGSNFYLEPDATIDDVIDKLRRQGVLPTSENDSLVLSQHISPTANGAPGSGPVPPSPNRDASPIAPPAPISNDEPRTDAANGPSERDLFGSGSAGAPDGPATPVPSGSESARPISLPVFSPPPLPASAGSLSAQPASAPAAHSIEGTPADTPTRSFMVEPGSHSMPIVPLRRVPAPSASPDRVAAALVEMIREEGPIVVEILFRHYVHASGGHKVGNQIRQDLLRALTRAAAAGQVIVRNELGVEDMLRAVVRTPATPEVVVRDRTPEYSIREIPPSELASVMRSVGGDYQGASHGEALYRRVLRRYHMVRLTEDAKRYLEEIANFYLK